MDAEEAEKLAPGTNAVVPDATVQATGEETADATTHDGKESTKGSEELAATGSLQDIQESMEEDMALGDRKPSPLLRGMGALDGSMRVHDSILQILRLNSSPCHIQTILQVKPNPPLGELAETADHVVSAFLPQPPVFVDAAATTEHNSELASPVDETAHLMDSIQRHLDQCPPLCPETNPQSLGRKADTTHQSDESRCYYQWRFGD
nr:uncharacterized protein LOC119167800 [Rhipicephalus microplus]